MLSKIYHKSYSNVLFLQITRKNTLTNHISTADIVAITTLQADYHNKGYYFSKKTC